MVRTALRAGIPFLFSLMIALPEVSGQGFTNRYALILEDSPVSKQFASREAAQSVQAGDHRRMVEAKQQALRRELSTRKIQVTSSVSTVLNAVFVAASPEREAELKSLPGVKAVVRLRRYRPNLNQAVQLVNAPSAWSALGGTGSAGQGMKIAIIDSGIDQNHPAFQDPSLTPPAGFPICSGSDCAYTNSKVIVARSYVRMLAAGSSSSNPAADSRPDDYSPRDRSGHGTAVASCAAGATNTGALTITGIAPKAFLGNYKIFGSPEVNDGASDDVIIQAIEDALSDGMDVASLSVGGPAFSGPLDSGPICGNPPGVACDLMAEAVENATNAGMLVVVAAGNEGQDGVNVPTFNTIGSPGTAPSAIAVGATTNAHIFVESVLLQGSDVPPNLGRLPAQFGTGFVPVTPITAPLRDVTTVGDDGLACSALPSGSMTGTFALILRGTCLFSDKLANAQAAGAVGIVFYMADDSAPIIPGGLAGTSIAAVMVSNSNGLALKSFLASSPNHPVTLDPTPFEQLVSGANQLVFYSSLGPNAGTAGIKPDLVATGDTMYMAAQKYDPLGELYDPSGYVVASGTSFATPLVSGAAALVKQSHAGFTPAQVKSALVNTASQDVTTDDSGDPVGVQEIGAGKLDAGAAVRTTVTLVPPTLSFGALGGLPLSQQVRVTNAGASAANLAISVMPGSGGATVSGDKQSLSLGAGASDTFNLTVSGTIPVPGSYSGFVLLQGSGMILRVPYLYFVSGSSIGNLIPLTGGGFDGTINEAIPDGIISFRVIDQFGLPMQGVAVTFTAPNGGTLQDVDAQTDSFGIAAAVPILGSQPGSYTFNGSAGRFRATFSGNARAKPNIPANGIINTASGENNKPVAPGSYITIQGSNLSDSTSSTEAAILPLAIDNVNVSFDVPSAGISAPGHLVYVSANEIHVQVPWELQGQSSVQVKVIIDFTYGNLYTLALANYAPAFFETADGVAALNANYQVVGTGNPAQRGGTVYLFASGLGPVTNQPASGDPAPDSPLAETTALPIVMIGGKQATVTLCSLTPGDAATYQVNITVPADLAPGTYPTTVSAGGQTSKAAQLVVQ
jgi:minor extracellular serine protease Vpr